MDSFSRRIPPNPLILIQPTPNPSKMQPFFTQNVTISPFIFSFKFLNNPLPPPTKFPQISDFIFTGIHPSIHPLFLLSIHPSIHLPLPPNIHPFQGPMDYYMDFFLRRRNSPCPRTLHSSSSFRLRRPSSSPQNNTLSDLIGNSRFSRPKNGSSSGRLDSPSIFRVLSNAVRSYAPIFTIPSIQSPPAPRLPSTLNLAPKMTTSTICRTRSLRSRERSPMGPAAGEYSRRNGNWRENGRKMEGKEKEEKTTTNLGGNEEGRKMEEKGKLEEKKKEEMEEKEEEIGGKWAKEEEIGGKWAKEEEIGGKWAKEEEIGGKWAKEEEKIAPKESTFSVKMKNEEKKEEILRENEERRPMEAKKIVPENGEKEDWGIGQKLKKALGIGQQGRKEKRRRNKKLADFCETVSLFELEGASIEEPEFKGQLLDRRHFHEHFDTAAYLRDFYARVEDPAMQLILFNLPNLVVRLGPIDSLLDFGCGPTIHVAVCFREAVRHIYLADYLPQNREELGRWLQGKSAFDWRCVLRIIADREALPMSQIGQMEQQTRAKVRSILHCDCHRSPAVQIARGLLVPSGQFGAITSFLTIEYCCLTRVEYGLAIQRICAHLAPGGFLIMGGVLEETWCAFGGHKFACLYIDRQFMLNCLSAAGLRLWKDHLGTKLYYESQGMFLLVAKKEEGENGEKGDISDYEN